ncbi:P-loop containing nucleoside triphosphate hydrolase protein [Mycena latifolia]|nr:P-loop containing nucleoside triphosphate hydrolase protein [Mycena latifolia]
MEIGRGGVRPKYIGGGVWNNNPTSLVVAEANKMYPSQPVVLVGFEQQHWGRSGEVSAHTRVYLGTEDAKSKLTSAVNVILNPVVPMSNSPTNLKICPPPSVRFTGREDILQQTMEYFNTRIGQQHIFLLHGLGGSGKSQIAFKFVEQSTSMLESRFTNVYFVDGSSQQTIENDLVTLALAKKVGKTFQDSLLWLSNQHMEWLIVFNNADDINLVQYFPSGSHGNILVTSRNPDLGQLAQATHKVEQMALEEATDLLLSAACYDIMEMANRDAGAFISSSRALPKYLDLYEHTASRMQLLHQKPPQSEYGWSVYATWQISFNNISSQARELLQLCSFIHHDQITEDIFQQATLYQITPDGLTEADLLEPLGFLAKFLDSTGSKWDSLKFIALTGELVRFSLIEFQAALGDITFSIHQLTGLDSSCHPNILDATFASQCLWVYHKEGKWSDGVRLGESMLHTLVSQLDEQQTLTIQGHLAIMRKELLGEDHPDTLTTMGNLAFNYSQMGQFHQAAEVEKVVLSKRRELLGEDHPDTLHSLADLGFICFKMSHLAEACKLQEQALNARRRVLGEGHPDTVDTAHQLAATIAQLEGIGSQ